MYIYLIFDPFSRLTKIGKSKNPKARFRQARTFNPNCELLFISNEYEESFLHEKFKHKKNNGEWFSLDKTDIFSITKNKKCIPKTLFYTNTKKDIIRKAINDRLNDSKLNCKWRFKNHPHIQITECKKIFNTKTGREKKLTVNGYSKGLWIDRKFICQKDLNKHIEIIPKEYFYL